MRSTEQIILFGRYRVLGILGEGASSQVYLVEHLKLQTYRAMKRISKSHPLLSQFRLEANLLKSFHHPSIPVIYDMEEDEQYLFIIEEYVEGESLQEYLLYHDTISEEYILQLGIHICDVFAYLHSRRPSPVCYRDLKPEHIIVCGNFVKIIDFGIAVYMTNEKENVPMGTIRYAAPEQYGKESLTPAADIYALGRVLQQMEQQVKGCSPSLHRIIQKAVEKDTQRRYESAVELGQALEQERKRICSHTVRKSHLYTHIAVVGAGRGSGTTHIAFAITAYLNYIGQACVYQSHHERNPIEVLIRTKDAEEMQDGIYQSGLLLGIPEGGQVQEGYLCVMDFGDMTDECIAEEADITLLVISGSAWRKEEAIRTIDKMGNVENLIVLCNQGTKGSCRRYADGTGRQVYAFPQDEYPLAVTAEKRKLFEKLLQMKKHHTKWKRKRMGRRNAIFSKAWRG